MKKIFVVLLALCAMLTFAACGDNSGAVINPPDNGTQIEQPDESELPNIPDDDKKEITVMYLYINENKIEVTLAENRAVSALIDILKQEDITYTANDYGGFEKVGNIGHTLPRNDEAISTSAGDVILYQGNNICLYYGHNSWTFTRIGRINGYSVAELRALLCAGSGSVQVRISLK